MCLSHGVHPNDYEQAKLEAVAVKRGLSPAECARQLLAASLPDPVSTDRTLDLFATWDAEDATDDPEEIERRNREWEAFKTNMNENRAVAGARLLYP